MADILKLFSESEIFKLAKKKLSLPEDLLFNELTEEQFLLVILEMKNIRAVQLEYNIDIEEYKKRFYTEQ